MNKLWLCVLMVLALPSYAAEVPWYEQTNNGTQVVAASKTVGGIGSVQVANPGGYYIYRPTSAAETSDSSTVIDIRACGGLGPTIQMWTDTAGVDYTARGFLYSCPTATFSETTCIKILADLDGGGVDNTAFNGDDGSDADGDLTLEQRAWMTAVAFPFIAFHHTTNSSLTNTSATEGNVQVGLYCAAF